MFVETCLTKKHEKLKIHFPALFFIWISLSSVFESTISLGQNVEGNNNYILVLLTSIQNANLTVEEKQVIENNHLRNIGRMSENGLIANAGPFEGGGEIMLLNTTTRNETESLLEQDPAISNGLMTMEILSLQIRIGGICDPVFPYEMKTYSFVRYSPTNQIASYKTNSDLEMKRSHQRHIEMLTASGSIIMEGVFPANDGGIMIFKGSSLNEDINKDPAIMEGYLKSEIKTIWLNKGSFCDN